MTKLLLLIPTLDRSGAEKQFSLLATRLPRDEFDVQVVALTRGGPYEEPIRAAGIPCTIIGKRWKFDPAALLRLKRVLKESSPDILHSWLFAANATARMIAGKKPRPRVVISERCVDSWKSGWQLSLDRRQIPRTTRLIGNSQAVADFYRNLGMPDEKLAVIPNGVEIPDLSNSNRDQRLQEFDIPPGSHVIGYVGRLARQKRVQDVVWAMQLLRQCRDRVYLMIVGDGPEKSDLIHLAQHYGCDHLVRFAGHRDDASSLFSLFTVFWLASDFEGMSNSIMEAMAAGVPVVATDIAANRELVVDGETGYLVKVGDCVGISQFTDRLLADPAKLRQMGDAGRERMRSNFSIDKMVAAHVALYRDIMNKDA
ncbi:MAG: glycosyltransferase [Planctomycetaceae bacterium]